MVYHRNSDNKNVPNKAAIGYVLNTGFSTKQGKLVRTILFSTERVTVSSKEAAAFLLTLFVFALASASYTLYDGLQDDSKSRRSTYKLIIACTRILTNVVPPEFPITLSLAVTLSLVQLVQKADVYCTEPFRVPLCGRIDVCCFDKTGTLTSENFHVASVEHENEYSTLVLGACHSLVSVNGKIVGDPLERAAAERVKVTLSAGTDRIVFPSNERVDILKRHAFSSELKRMTVLVRRSKGSSVVALTKGAPEVLAPLFSDAPADLLVEATRLAKLGMRVLALGWREIQEKVLNEPREGIEQEFHFAGLLCLTADIKENTVSTIKQLKSSHHRLVMITGDHPLTACHVAMEVGLLDQQDCCMYAGNGRWVLNDEEYFSAEMTHKYGLCIDGAQLTAASAQEFVDLVKVVSIFARVSPQQKEQILLALNEDKFTLMAGDGTNDVGALKAAHCGVSILSTAVKTSSVDNRRQADDSLPPVVSLGDASIASPFTSKRNNIKCVLYLLRSGRSTLCTVMQMYKIMALNSLISAFAMSILTLDGVKLGDGQTALESILISVCFFLVSKSAPAKKLCTRKPATSVFAPSILISLILQLAVHMTVLVVGWKFARTYRAKDFDRNIDGDFAPDVVNSVVFLLIATMHTGSFIANYDGHPFLRPLWENKHLMTCVLTSLMVLFLCALEVIPALNEQLSLVLAPDDAFRRKMAALVAIDLIGSIGCAHGLRILFGFFEERRLASFNSS